MMVKLAAMTGLATAAAQMLYWRTLDSRWAHASALSGSLFFLSTLALILGWR